MFMRSALVMLFVALCTSLAAQTITLSNGPVIAGGTTPSGANAVAAASFNLARSGANSLFTALTLVNGGTATGSDYVRYQLWRENDNNGQFSGGDLLLASANSPSLAFSGFSTQVPISPATFYVSVDVAAGATDGRTFQLSITAANVTVSQGTKTGGPVNGPTLTVSTPTQLVITTQPGGALGGTAFTTQPVVEVRNASNVLVTSFSGNIAVAKSAGPAGTLSGTLFVAAVGGVGTFTNLSIDLAGTGYQLTFTTGSLTPAVSTPFAVSVGSANKLSVQTQPGGASGGLAFATQPVIHVLDAGNNLVSASSATVTAAITSGTGTAGAALGGTTAQAASSGVATFSNLSINLAGTGYSLTFTATSLTSAVSATFNVTVGSATQLAVQAQPGGASGGQAFTTQPVVHVLDAGGNLVTSSGLSISAAISTGTGTAGSTLGGTTAQAASGGVASFSNLSIDLAGSGYRLTFSATGVSSVDSALFNVIVGAAAKLAITTQPAGSTGGVSLAAQPVVVVQDAGGNLVSSSGATVSASITPATGTGGATLLGTTSQAAAAGVATFTNLAIDLAGTGYSLTFASAGLTSAISGTFNITVGAAASLSVSTQPAGASGGTQFATQPVVQVVDAGGNLVTGAGNSITVSIKAGTGTTGAALSGTLTLAASGGVATWLDLAIDLAGTAYELEFNDGSLPTATSAAFDVTIGSPVALRVATDPAGAVQATVFATQPQIEIVDAGGNRITSDNTTQISVTIVASTGTAGAVLSGTTPVTMTAGLATFTDLEIDLPGADYELEFSDGALSPVRCATFDVAGLPTLLGVSTQPASATAGALLGVQPAVEVRDAAGALVANDNSTQITVAILGGSGTPGAVLSGTLTLTVVNGVAAFTDLAIDLVGTGYQLSFTAAPALTPVDSAVFDVSTPATQLVVFTQPSLADPGVVFGQQPVIHLTDALGNIATGDSSTQVTATILSGTGTAGATLFGTATVTAVNGVATFTNLGIDLAGNGYQLTFVSTPVLTPTASNSFSVGTVSVGGGDSKDDEGCSTSGQSGMTLWLALALAVAGFTVRRMRRA